MIDHSIDQIDHFSKKLAAAQDLGTIHVLVREQIERLGFEQFSYQLLWPPDGPRRPLFITNFPAAWTERYIDQKYISLDMVSRTAASNRLPFLWPDQKQQKTFTTDQRLIFDEAREFGQYTGGAVPLYGPGLAKALLSVTNRMPEEEFAKLFLARRHELHLIATYTHDRMLAIGLDTPPPSDVKLTPREIEIMTWCARGKTSGEIGDILSISENTVNEHFRNVCRKLGVFNKHHATAIAVIHALILP